MIAQNISTVSTLVTYRLPLATAFAGWGGSPIPESVGPKITAVTRAFVLPTDDLSQRADDSHMPLPKYRLYFGFAGALELDRRWADKIRANTWAMSP